MPFVIMLLTLLVVIASGITTIPFSIGLLAVFTVLFRKSWMFFVALGLGLILDLVAVRALGYTSLIFILFVFMIFLYERKFETQTTAFVAISTFLGSFAYLKIFDYQQIFFQSLINSLLAILFFKFLWSKLGPHSEII